MHGGIYSDVDTLLLKEPIQWGQGAELWKGGQGWIPAEYIVKLESTDEGSKEAEVDRLLGRANVIVGIEADADELDEWATIWPRPVSTSSFSHFSSADTSATNHTVDYGFPILSSYLYIMSTSNLT